MACSEDGIRRSVARWHRQRSTLNQALPGRINLAVSYVGDNNRFLINGGSTQPVTLDNVNAIPIGGLYKPDPDTASPQYGQVLTNLNLNTLPYSPIYTSP